MMKGLYRVHWRLSEDFMPKHSFSMEVNITRQALRVRVWATMLLPDSLHIRPPAISLCCRCFLQSQHAPDDYPSPVMQKMACRQRQNTWNSSFGAISNRLPKDVMLSHKLKTMPTKRGARTQISAAEMVDQFLEFFNFP